MTGPQARWIFLLGFLAACAAFWVGYRRIRRVRGARNRREAFRLAFSLSLALMVGCSGTSTTGRETTTTTAPARGPTGLGSEADGVWTELLALWDEAGTFVEGEVSGDQLSAARGRADGLLARLGGIDRVTSDAPGLVALLRIEFQARLEMRPAETMCYEPMPPRTEGAVAYERLTARTAAVEELATRGYVNGWLQAEILARLREDLATVRTAMAEGDDWRTEDYALRQVEPAETQALVERIGAALARLGEP